MNKNSSLQGISIKGRLLLFAVVAVCLMVLTAVLGLVTVTMTNNAQDERFDYYAESETYILSAFGGFQEIKVHLRNMVYVYDGNSAKQAEEEAMVLEKIAETQGYLNDLDPLMDVLGSKLESIYKNTLNYFENYSDSAKKVVEYQKAGNTEAARTELLGNTISAATYAENETRTYIEQMTIALDKITESVNQTRTMLTLIIVCVCIAGLLIFIIFSGATLKAITVPMDMISEVAEKLAVGDVEVECKKIRNDEFGLLMDDMAALISATKDQAKVAHSISTGDLTVKVKPCGEKDIVGNALYKLVEDNNSILSDIKEATLQVTTGAQQVATASQTLAQGSTEQASALEQVTASMAEISERTKTNAAEASEADELVSSVKSMAIEGNQQMDDMITAMNDINESSETISKIIKVIDDIAFQTNILALNAAVEAARAGVHGKGFAVVAEEVRNLAAKSASAASETAEMIEDSIRKVNNGTKLAEETAKSLDKIVTSINKVATLVSDISVASNNQATAVTQIDQALGQVANVVQTNSATSEECAAASEELSSQAATLRSLVGIFKLASNGRGDKYRYREESVPNYGSSNNESIISLDGSFGKY